VIEIINSMVDEVGDHLIAWRWPAGTSVDHSGKPWLLKHPCAIDHHIGREELGNRYTSTILPGGEKNGLRPLVLGVWSLHGMPAMQRRMQNQQVRPGRCALVQRI